MKIAIIGGGNMGASFAKCILAKGILDPGDLLVVEHDEARRRILEERGCRAEREPGPSLGDYGIILLAVKPQSMESACRECVPHLAPETLVISIMAGITLDVLSSSLGGHTRLVRCMPNMPAQIGMGMSVFVPYPDLDEEDCETASRLFRAVGASLRVESESLIDAATALSGSGPAYVFYVIEHMLSAATTLGFSEREAKLLLQHTLQGSVNMWAQSERSAQELREMVTSKGGTTAAALEVFERVKLGAGIEEGIVAAQKRAEALGRERER